MEIPQNYRLGEPSIQEDGSEVYDIHDADVPEETAEPSSGFYDNLALTLPDQILNNLSSFLIGRIDQDIDSRKEWLQSVTSVKEYLGFAIEDSKEAPFPRATRTFDTTLSTALVRFYSIMRSEFFPDSGPAHIKFPENSFQDDEQQSVLEDKIKDTLNSYLTRGDKDYYADCQRSLIYLGFYGNVVKKVFVDPSTEKVLSRFIIPEDFIVNNDCLSLMESERLTHVLKMSERDILMLEKSGYYKTYDQSISSLNSSKESDRDVTSKDAGIDVSSYENKTLKVIYETHAYLSLKSFGEMGIGIQTVEEKEVSLPYIVTFDPDTKKIFRIIRNWEEQDPLCKKINYFVNYQYLPGFGIYGLGLAHLLGTNAITLTKILRQLIDAASFKNLPGGLRQKGVKQQKSDLLIGPGQFVEVDTGSRPIQDVFMPLPYSEPSSALISLRNELIAQTQELAATAELKMNDQNPQQPVGTTLAMLEMNQKIQAATFKNFYFSLSDELSKIFDLMKPSLPDLQDIPQEQMMEIVPIADPALDSKMHRLLKAESLLQVAKEFPDLYDLNEINRRYCQALGITDMEKIFKSQEMPEIPALDPITENMRALKGEPIQAYVWQDHDSHIVVHGSLAAENPQIQSHIADHRAFSYLMKMQQQMGMEMPPEEELQQNQELQNEIAYKAAEATMAHPDPASQPPVDPKVQAMKEIASAELQQKMMQAQLQYEQKMAEIASKEKIEQSRAQTATFKAQLDYEREQDKIEAEKEIAEMKQNDETVRKEMT